MRNRDRIDVERVDVGERPDGGELVDTSTAARRLGVSVKTVYRYIDGGVLETTRPYERAPHRIVARSVDAQLRRMQITRRW